MPSAGTTPRIGLPRIDPGQSQADVTHNQALNLLDTFLGVIAVINITTSAPPGSPADGDAYLVAAGGSGLWTGKDGQFAIAFGGGWYFVAVAYGLQYYDRSNGNLKIWSRTAAWVSIGVY